MSGLLSCFSSKGSNDNDQLRPPVRILPKERDSKDRNSTRSQESVGRNSGNRKKEKDRLSSQAPPLQDRAAAPKRQSKEEVGKARSATPNSGNDPGAKRSSSGPGEIGPPRVRPEQPTIPSSKSHDAQSHHPSSWRSNLVDTADDTQVRAVPLRSEESTRAKPTRTEQVISQLAPPSPWAHRAPDGETELLSGSSDARGFDSDAREYVPAGLLQEPLIPSVHPATSDSAGSLRAGSGRQSQAATSDSSQGDGMIQFPPDLGRKPTINLRGAPKLTFTDADEDQAAATMQRFEEIGSYRIPLKSIRLKCKNGRPIVLGSGGFGKVFHGSLYREDCAIKVVLEGTRKEQARFLTEIKILERLKTATITRFMGYSVTPEGLLLIMEYVAGGTLTKSLETSDRHQWYNGGKQVLLNVAIALCVLHANRVAHLDIKSPNILLTSAGEAKVADVGLGKLMKGEVSLVSRIGTVAWASPEQLCGTVGTHADIWAIGTVIWEICTREKPPMNRHLREIEVPEEAPQEVADLIDFCHHQNWRERIDAEQLHELLDACSQTRP